MRHVTGLPEPRPTWSTGRATPPGRVGDDPAGPTRTRRRAPVVTAVLVLLLAGTAVLTVCLGTPTVSPAALLDLVAQPKVAGIVVTELRLPRLLVALVAGAALGACGLVLQESLRNPLATPDLLGVGPGAALVMAVVVVTGLAVPAALYPVAALMGALAGGGLTVLVARSVSGPTAVLLVGAAIAAAVSGLVVAVVASAEQLQIAALFTYLAGSLAGVTWATAIPALLWLAALLPLTLLTVPALDILRLGDDTAAALGLRPQRTRVLLLLLVATLVAGVVAVAGPIAWVGFLAPHLVRRLHPHARTRSWLGLAMLAGALVTAVADLAARLVFAPVETPVGAWTAMAGVAVGFAGLARSGRRPAVPVPAADADPTRRTGQT
ncbi:iron ABC transporter permease [Nakamurella flava]|uniref:Iron ABC transporter permease n=1 Tax=Nakamurella flava TaxID=2576308 RepID=A0A4U6QFZ7_9ACTN|nr:iron ABC transporter permease [Nakamurella flava]TKV59217.1 iron ABC transporter permease [Nakamurella flava]